MAHATAKKLRLETSTLVIALLPLLVISLSSALVHWFGTFAGELQAPAAAANHAEAAGRLRALTTWLVMLAVVLVCLAYFVRSVRVLERGSLRVLALAYAVLAIAGLVLVYFGFAGEANRAVADEFIQAALNLPISRPPPGPFDLIAFHGTEFDLLQALNWIQRYLLALLTPALVLGSIACLAMPQRKTIADCRRQSERLNNYLYLSAAVLVAGLIFLAAMLRWPGYALPEAAAARYNGHVDAYVFYWGVTYSILIASYYVPVALRLAGIGGAVAESGEAAPSASEHLIATAKALAALFAPAIAGLLGGFIQL